MSFLDTEKVMDAAALVVFQYIYIADGVLIRNEFPEDYLTVAGLKARCGYKEIRRCEMFAPEREKMRLGDSVL